MVERNVILDYDTSSCCDQKEPHEADGGFVIPNEALRISIRGAFLGLLNTIINAYNKEDFLEANNQNVRDDIQDAIKDIKTIIDYVDKLRTTDGTKY